ncbi:MAG: hypothetical protein JKY46_02915 [Robiginitomaculum sp.]|nr:hypothetical protein [Robiginitomaculum sp.]
MNKNTKNYFVRMLVAFSIYTVLLVGMNVVDNIFELPQWQRIAMSILPVIPAIAIIFIILEFVRTMDEVWQRIITESTLISMGIVGIATFTLGFMEGVIQLPDGILIWIWPAMIGIQGLAMQFVRRRY